MELRVPDRGNTPFSNVTNLSYPTASSGASIGLIDLTGIAALQNVGANTNVTFRIVNWNGSSAGMWYIVNAADSPAPDFAIQGTVSEIVASPPAAAPIFTSIPYTNDQFRFRLVGSVGTITLSKPVPIFHQRFGFQF